MKRPLAVALAVLLVLTLPVAPAGRVFGQTVSQTGTTVGAGGDAAAASSGGGGPGGAAPTAIAIPSLGVTGALAPAAGAPALAAGAASVATSAPPVLPSAAVDAGRAANAVSGAALSQPPGDLDLDSGAADISAILENSEGGDQAGAAAAVGTRVFDGAAVIEPMAVGPSENPVESPRSGLFARASPPYQKELVRLGMFSGSVQRLNDFIVSRRPGGSALASIRSANIMAAITGASAWSAISDFGKTQLIVAALLCPTDAGDRAANIEAQPVPDSAGLNRFLLVSLLKYAYSELDSDPDAAAHARQDGESLAKTFKVVRTQSWVRRWGPRVAYIVQIAPFALAELPDSAVENPKRAAPRLQALVDDANFALLPPELQANLRQALQMLRVRAGLPAAPAPSEQYLDSAVEIEVASIPKILNILTTPDGTVDSLMRHPKRKTPIALPAGFPTHPTGGEVGADLRSLRWDSLHPDDKLLLLRHLTSFKKTDFFEDRRIPGVSVKKEVVLNFKRSTGFLGQTYAPGSHRVDVSRVFQGPVEYASRAYVKSVGYVEIHLRAHLSAGAVSNDAWTFLDALGVARTHQHVHIVAPLPRQALEAEPNLEAAVLGDFYRRVNLLAEMSTLFDDGFPIEEKARRKIVYFAPLRAENLVGVTRYFRRVGQGRRRPIGDEYKQAWVGFRGSDTYDQPGLYGLEYRAILGDVDEIIYRERLNDIQRAMVRREYGLDKSRIKTWLGERSAPEAVGKSWYNRPWEELLQSASSEVKGQLKPRLVKVLASKKNTTAHVEIKMLVHDWSDDPLVFGDVALEKKITGAQARALARLNPSLENLSIVMHDFLIDSGLYERVAQSLKSSSRTL